MLTQVKRRRMSVHLQKEIRIISKLKIRGKADCLEKVAIIQLQRNNNNNIQ